MRINKYLAEMGVASRRESDAWIAAGRVTINGRLAELGSVVAETDTVCLDQQPLQRKPTKIYLALNKPRGITCTTERSVAGNIVDFINHEQRIFPIGRLDKDSEGLILLTNDGDIVNAILRAEQKKEKEYLVTVDRDLSEACLQGMAGGVRILGRMTQPCTVEQCAPRIFRIILTQGLNRQIRRMCEVWGYRVRRLQRVRIMHIKLGNLPLGKWRTLTKDELDELLSALKKPADSAKIKKQDKPRHKRSEHASWQSKKNRRRN